MDMEITIPSAVVENSHSLSRNDAVIKSSPEQTDPKRTNTKPLSFTNGVLKRHHTAASPPPPPSSAAAVAYRECLKNHAAALGGHALDGCGEFMPDRSSNPNLPISLKCAACGCHRNFHRREPEDLPKAIQLLTPPPISTTTAIEYRSQSHHHRHLQTPVPITSARPTSPYPPSPPPISSSYYPSSAPHMLLALSTGLPPPENTHAQQAAGGMAIAADPGPAGSGRKRFRTKFSSLQKEKMYEVAERVGWKMQKRDEELVNELCNRIGVGREVFKVWMHNNKSTFSKRSSSSADAAGNTNKNVFFHNGGIGLHHDNGEVNATVQRGLPSHNDNLNGVNGGDMAQQQQQQQHHHHRHHSEGSGGLVTTNGSFSSS